MLRRDEMLTTVRSLYVHHQRQCFSARVGCGLVGGRRYSHALAAVTEPTLNRALAAFGAPSRLRSLDSTLLTEAPAREPFTLPPIVDCCKAITRPLSSRGAALPAGSSAAHTSQNPHTNCEWHAPRGMAAARLVKAVGHA